nr:MAG TPA: hypothetical protein [Caudoviricetes sp.]
MYMTPELFRLCRVTHVVRNLIRGDLRMHKRIQYGGRVFCNETLERSLNCVRPHMALSGALMINVRQDFLSVLFLEAVAVSCFHCEERPEVQQFVEVPKRKHLLPPYTCAVCPAMLHVDVYE